MNSDSPPEVSLTTLDEVPDILTDLARVSTFEKTSEMILSIAAAIESDVSDVLASPNEHPGSNPADKLTAIAAEMRRLAQSANFTDGDIPSTLEARHPSTTSDTLEAPANGHVRAMADVRLLPHMFGLCPQRGGIHTYYMSCFLAD